MADEQDKTSPPHRDGSPDKAVARRDRQAQALRRNLARRKAQVRGRNQDDAPQGQAARPKDEPSSR